MTHPTRMTLLTGNKSGFTFVEVMVAMVILAAGIVAVYRSFFLCVDYLNNISTRWWANELVEEKITEVSRLLQESKGTDVGLASTVQTVTINHRPINYTYDISLTPYSALPGIYQLNVALAWHDGHRPMHINRSLYLLK